jgi:hypothetical protein
MKSALQSVTVLVSSRKKIDGFLMAELEGVARSRSQSPRQLFDSKMFTYLVGKNKLELATKICFLWQPFIHFKHLHPLYVSCSLSAHATEYHFNGYTR